MLNLNTHCSKTVKEFCPYCRKVVEAGDFFDNHVKRCHSLATESGSLLKLPNTGETMKFKNYKNTLERPFIVIADLESSLEKTGREDRIHKHVPNSCCYYFMCSFDPSRNALRAFEGEDCVEDMIVELKELADACVLEMKGNEEMVMTARDTEDFKDATCCGICKDPFKKDDVKVRDHCHRTGKFRGATHQKCNINYFSNRYLPVVFHNLRGYDSHFIIKKAYDISNRLENPRIDCIPNSYEKFMSFSIGRSLKFIDSLQFMASSLEKLVENLYDGEDKFKNFANMKNNSPTTWTSCAGKATTLTSGWTRWRSWTTRAYRRWSISTLR